MNTYTLFWLDGKSEIVNGENTAQAMMLAGYSSESLVSLAFSGYGDLRKQHIWDEVERKWRWITHCPKDQISALLGDNGIYNGHLCGRAHEPGDRFSCDPNIVNCPECVRILKEKGALK